MQTWWIADRRSYRFFPFCQDRKHMQKHFLFLRRTGPSISFSLLGHNIGAKGTHSLICNVYFKKDDNLPRTTTTPKFNSKLQPEFGVQWSFWPVKNDEHEYIPGIPICENKYFLKLVVFALLFYNFFSFHFGSFYDSGPKSVFLLNE